MSIIKIKPHSYWSMSTNCKLCGFTNRYFHKGRYIYKEEVRYYKSKICIECFHEKTRKYLRKYQTTPEYREWRNSYNSINRENVKIMNVINSKRYRTRMKEKNRLERLKRMMVGIVLK